MNSIIIPTDFSAVANNALRYAINVAEKTNTPLTVFHAYRIPLIVGNEVEAMLPEIEDDYEKNALTQLRVLKADFPRLQTIKHELKSAMGYLNDSIDILCKEENADLIIMGTSGASGWSEALGTRTTDVITKMHVPVLVIPEKASYKGIKKIALAYDYKSMENPKKLEILKAFASVFKAELHILYIAKSEETDSEEDFSSLAAIDDIFEKVEHKYRVRVKNDVEKGINDYVTEKSIDLLAVMPRKHGILDALFNRSITKKLACHTEVPLLVVQD